MNAGKKRTVNDLVELANGIKDKELRKKTVEFLRDPRITNAGMQYGATPLKEMPSWVGAHHYYEGGLVDHLYSVTSICIGIADVIDGCYKEKVKRDYLIAAALLHDICKVFQINNGKEGFSFSNHLMDHCVWACCELYARGFPEEAIAIIAGHGGESMNPIPRTIEGLILYHADSLDASVESADKKYDSVSTIKELLKVV